MNQLIGLGKNLKANNYRLQDRELEISTNLGHNYFEKMTMLLNTIRFKILVMTNLTIAFSKVATIHQPNSCFLQ